MNGPADQSADNIIWRIVGAVLFLIARYIVFRTHNIAAQSIYFNWNEKIGLAWVVRCLLASLYNLPRTAALE